MTSCNARASSSPAPRGRPGSRPCRSRPGTPPAVMTLPSITTRSATGRRAEVAQVVANAQWLVARALQDSGRAEQHRSRADRGRPLRRLVCTAHPLDRRRVLQERHLPRAGDDDDVRRWDLVERGVGGRHQADVGLLRPGCRGDELDRCVGAVERAPRRGRRRRVRSSRRRGTARSQASQSPSGRRRCWARSPASSMAPGWRGSWPARRRPGWWRCSRPGRRRRR